MCVCMNMCLYVYIINIQLYEIMTQYKKALNKDKVKTFQIYSIFLIKSNVDFSLQWC